MENKENSFSYTYSKKQSDEILKIKEKYLDAKKEKTNYEKIKELDASTMKTGQIVSFIVGILGSLILGTGMCLVMVWNSMLLGVVVGIIGMIGAIVSYPIYKALVKSSREKVKSEILRLCENEIK